MDTVSGATQYFISTHFPADPACSSSGGISFPGGSGVVSVLASKVCSAETCGFQQANQSGIVKDESSPYQKVIDYLHREKDCQGHPLVATWSARAVHGNISGSDSARGSFWLDLQATAPTVPKPVPSTGPDQVTFTCVFQSGAVLWAWFHGVALDFVSSSGVANPKYQGKIVRFSPAPFFNCSNVVAGAKPLGTTDIRVQRIALCSNLVTGQQHTFVNGTCPKAHYKMVSESGSNTGSETPDLKIPK